MPKGPLVTYDTACHVRLSIANTELITFVKQPPFRADRSLFRQFIQIGRMHIAVAIRRHEVAALLIAHDEHNVRLHKPTLFHRFFHCITYKIKIQAQNIASFYVLLCPYIFNLKWVFYHKAHTTRCKPRIALLLPAKNQISCIINCLPEVPYVGKMNTYHR